MVEQIVCGKEIELTILPYLYKKLEEDLIKYPHDNVLGYVVYNEETNSYTFTYTESGELVTIKKHWSFDIIKNGLYFEKSNRWIIYNCSPEKTALAARTFLSNYFHTLHIYNWDIWSVPSKNGKVAIITSFQTY
jgi:hypothetical protein